MSIKFHCEHCDRLIAAPDSSGGKRGRCPACKEVVYVPSHEAEALPLAPLDEVEERRRQKLVDDTLAKGHDLLMAQDRADALPPEATADGERPDDGQQPADSETAVAAAQEAAGDAEVGPKDLLMLYLCALADGKLQRAEILIEELRLDPRSARAAVGQVLTDSPRDRRIAHIPTPVISGFLKQLQHALK